jgi:membrane protein implicated in regulation of membrane protease activity
MPPMLTRPVGVFLQVLGAVAVIAGSAMLAFDIPWFGGVVVTLIGAGLLWLGQQTYRRKDEGSR